MDTKQKNLNHEVLNEMLDAVEQMLANIEVILNEDDESDHYENVRRAISKFVGQCEGSYYHSGNDGFYARLGK